MIKIIFEVNPSNQNEVKQAKDMLELLTGTEPAKKEPAKKEPAKKEPAKKEPAKKEPAKKEPAKKESEQAEEISQIDTIRLLLANKVREHRESIKTELDNLGATNVTSLDKKHYSKFENFLNSLD